MRYLGSVLGILLCLSATATAKQGGETDAAIKQRMIKSSIAHYSGNCPCPYNTASNGSRCGKRSAYHRAGGYTPLCYAEDITPKMLQDYKNRR